MMYGTIQEMRDAAAKLDALAYTLPPAMLQEIRKGGARIVRDAKILTPVDTGLLMNANRADVFQEGRTTTLLVSNRMVYAHYQHENVMNHKKKGARDHFVEIPFNEEVPRMVEGIKKLIKEATQ